MGTRPTHPNKELEKLIRKLESVGWAFTRGKKYFKGKCPCGSHSKTIRLTPSGAQYNTNLIHWFRRLECWNEEVTL